MSKTARELRLMFYAWRTRDIIANAIAPVLRELMRGLK